MCIRDRYEEKETWWSPKVSELPETHEMFPGNVYRERLYQMCIRDRNKISFIFLIVCIPFLVFLGISSFAAIIVWYILLSLDVYKRQAVRVM